MAMPASFGVSSLASTKGAISESPTQHVRMLENYWLTFMDFLKAIQLQSGLLSHLESANE
ncbi:protein of unknown function [Pseudomonas sp. JV241A]|nr:protein of unknown function [Pseudomonas sp. JV241A]